MSFRLIITDTADFEMRQSYRWLAELNRSAAERWRASLLTAIHSLAENPDRYPLATEEDLAEFGIRELLHGKRSRMHRILYWVSGDTVEILRVRHTAQNLLSIEDLGITEEE